MEEKKICTECENKGQKLERLTEEESDKVSGGCGFTGLYDYMCPECGAYVFSEFCPFCHVDRDGNHQ